MKNWPDLEQRPTERYGETKDVDFFVGTDVEWHDAIDRLEADPPSTPAAFPAEFPAVSREQLPGVLQGMAEAMGYADAWRALRLTLDPGEPDAPLMQDVRRYLRERLARRAVVEAWRDELAEAERAAGATR